MNKGEIHTFLIAFIIHAKINNKKTNFHRDSEQFYTDVEGCDLLFVVISIREVFPIIKCQLIF